jgi:hypothetical protein
MTDEEWETYEATDEESVTIIERLVHGWYEKSEKNKKQIDAAMAQIDPKIGLKDKCREAVTEAIITTSLDGYFRRSKVSTQTKTGKAALKSLARGFKLIDAALRNESLDPTIKGDVISSFLPMPPSGLKDLATFLYELAEHKTGRGTLTGEKTKAKKVAIGHAYQLLYSFTNPSIAGDAKKGSRLCKLSAILLGDDKADLSYQCEEYLEKMEKDRPIHDEIARILAKLSSQKKKREG